MKQEFTGRALSIDEILDMLQSQGLVIDDRSRAEHILKNVSYSRLKSYLVPLMEDRRTHRFAPGASFEDAYALYGFDRRLRELMFHEIEKIEISIRTHIAYASNGSENGYWFVNPKHFESAGAHAKILRQISYELSRSDNPEIISFRNKYSNEFPPCWLTLEATSMGTLAKIYDCMRAGELKRRISDCFGLDDQTFASWLWHLVSVRNDCAHHNCMWNGFTQSRAAIPLTTRDVFPEFTPEDGQHIYMTLCIIKYLQNTVKPTNTFTQRLASLIGGFKVVDSRMMGFPQNWKDDPFWK